MVRAPVGIHGRNSVPEPTTRKERFRRRFSTSGGVEYQRAWKARPESSREISWLVMRSQLRSEAGRSSGRRPNRLLCGCEWTRKVDGVRIDRLFSRLDLTREGSHLLLTRGQITP